MDQPVDPGGSLLRIEKKANKKDVTVGEVVTYTITIYNETSSAVTSTYIEDNTPGGFKYLNDRAVLDGTTIADPTGKRPLIFNTGTINANSSRTLKYQLVVGSGVTFGKYKNTAHAIYAGGDGISSVVTESVNVVPDPLFDLATVIGKVFWDLNENGIQDPPRRNSPLVIEKGIPDIRIVTEDGTVVTTDKDGKYHIPGVIPGRHAFRLDESTLPEGAYLTTPKVVIEDIRQGLTSKVNFGVNLRKGISVTKTPFKISQDKGLPKPRLNVALFNKKLIIKDNRLKEKAEFRIFTNYHLFIKTWKLEIFDKDAKRIIKTFKGKKDNIFKPIYWDGKDNKNKLITTEKDYAYMLTVTCPKGKKDITKEKDMQVTNYDPKAIDLNEEDEYKEWIKEESKLNNLEKQTIIIRGETIKITTQQMSPTNIKVIGSGKVTEEISY